MTNKCDIYCPACDYSPLQYARYAWQTDIPRTREEVLDFFEVAGADEGYVFCPECSHEFKPPLERKP